MIPWIRVFILGLFILTIIYVVLSSLSRMCHRNKLKLDYKANNAETTQEQFIAMGMHKYERSLKPKLFVGVYLFPLAVISLLVYLAQT